MNSSLPCYKFNLLHLVSRSGREDVEIQWKLEHRDVFSACLFITTGSQMASPRERKTKPSDLVSLLVALLLCSNYNLSCQGATSDDMGIPAQEHTQKEQERYVEEGVTATKDELEKKSRMLVPSDATIRMSLAFSRYITVDKHGKGQYNSVQAAINSVPVGNSKWVYIQINAGFYFEKVTIPYNKPFIMFQGAGRLTSVISWSDTASKYGTANSATFSALAHSFIAKGVGFRNAAPSPFPGSYGGQAVAVLLSGDMMAFYGCGFYGAQDTLFDYQGRHYFKGCYIEGSIDFIFGHGQSTYKGCDLVVKARPGYVSGSITAQNRNNPRDGGGFVFVNCRILGTGQVYLGRAWGAYSRVVFMYTYMSGIIVPEGWYDWGNPGRHGTVFYGQYKCWGPGARAARRVKWSHQLSDAQAQPYLQLSFINGGSWLQEA